MILVIDNYDSFTYNLVQYLGEYEQVTVRRNDDKDLYSLAEEANGLVFSPGPGWPADAGLMEQMIKDFAGKKPILGICLGHQAIAEVFGGRLGLAKQTMHGKQSQMEQLIDSPLFDGLPRKSAIMRYHSIVIETLPESFDVVAKTSDDQEIMAIQHHRLPIYGLQYHPESIGTDNGLTMIHNFVKVVKDYERNL
ncbi:aminodeoxychorismate/anthranilate synthase component II [Streptococcus moroccensis]|uniref:Anthranilate synthase/aminodeoxychorismate synthase-like glutamine amidotransferase n=1 Tax=Streptococcus moroccensis TaxID=1451356 RepID=A0ABT9YQJ2_9STRE|nr:aminodeoxychorismate/anthranilate synthase component II [Streptococcus moroccensis]MDQ0222266.1 anthranilate synthase/aminodeoxychorismate synthase-like glutamine amidotransferase [Streptococcus moroccensis]